MTAGLYSGRLNRWLRNATGDGLNKLDSVVDAEKTAAGAGKRASPQTSNGCPAEAGRYRRKNFLTGEAVSVEIFGWRQSGGKPPHSKGIYAARRAGI